MNSPQLPQGGPHLASLLADAARHAMDMLGGPKPPTAATEPAPTERAAAQPGDAIAIPLPILQIATSIATNAWRAQQKMIDPATRQTRDEMKRVARHVDANLDALRQLGLEIDDPEGRPYDTGMALKVVSFEPVAGLSREEITETLRPSIRLQGRVLQIGEVVVGTPLQP